MNRRRGCLWFAAGLLLAIMAGVVAFVTMQRVASAPKEKEEPPRVQVVVAARDIPLHTVIAAADVEVRDVPPEMVPTGGLSDAKDAVGKLTTTALARGEIVVGQRLIAPDYTGPNAAFVMDPNQVIVAFPTNDLLGSVDIIRPGDHIDIMYSFDFTKANADVITGMNTLTVLQNVRVAAVIRGGGSAEQQAAGKAPVRALLLALDPQDALTLKYFRDSGGAQDLALRSPVAGGAFAVVPVDGDYVINKYQIRWRPKP